MSPAPEPERSGERWLGAVLPSAAERLLAAGLPRRLAELLALRGVSDEIDARAFLEPTREQLLPCDKLAGLDRAVGRLARATADGEFVVVLGDYDVDGIAATALLVAVLRSAGARVEPILAHRHEEGYGFQEVHARRARELGATLLVTVDCGTNSHAAALEARRLGLDLIVTDHHLPEGEDPEGAVVVNPRRTVCAYPFEHLTGAGLAFKIAVALLDRLGRAVPWDSLLRMACLGTIADVAPLRGENRVLAALGLAALERSHSAGLRALLESAGLSRARLRASDVGFRLAPRLNAAGRLGTPEPALELLLERDEGRARDLAAALEAWNRERQQIEARMLEQARRALESRGVTPPIVVLSSPDWNRGVVGIAAARLTRELGRPVLLLAEADGFATGSGRSLPSIDLHGFLKRWSPALARFGGHALAVGMTVALDRLEGLVAEWEAAAATWGIDGLVLERRYDLELAPDEVGAPIVELLARLEPCGAGNEEPLFRIGPLAATGPLRRFGNGHGAVLVAPAEGGRPFEAFGWGWARRLAALPPRFEVLARVERDRFRGGARLELHALRAVEGAAAP